MDGERQDKRHGSAAFDNARAHTMDIRRRGYSEWQQQQRLVNAKGHRTIIPRSINQVVSLTHRPSDKPFWLRSDEYLCTYYCSSPICSRMQRFSGIVIITVP